MQQISPLSLHAAAWFFVGNNDEVGEEKIVRIRTPFRIGRNPDCDLCLQCASVSGFHAEITEEDGDLWLEDLKSTNGTFVNSRRITQKCRLSSDDSLQFGTAVFHVNCSESSPEKGNFEIEGDAARLAESQNERLERLFNDGVVPFFQPILKLDRDARSLFGYEVLGRSRLFGLRTPAQMFAAASRLEMEAELSRVLRSHGISLADKNLPEQYALFVNTHPAELKCDGLEESLFDIRDHHPTRPITLEVHESVLNDPVKFIRLRTTLQNIDIQLAFHDFGAGEVRLAELCEVVPDAVKFDIRLIRGIDRAGARRQKFVAAMVRMMSDLGITPMAECVEQADEHETLKQLGFQLGQGFFYGRPCSIEDCVSSPVRRAETPRVKTFLNEREKEFQSDPFRGTGSARAKDADWLLRQPENHYTIQVLSAISESSARQFIEKQSKPEDFAIFCKQGKTRMLFIVVYGVFDDRTEAKAASARFTNTTVSPWIRMLSSVHAEIGS